MVADCPTTKQGGRGQPKGGAVLLLDGINQREGVGCQGCAGGGMRQHLGIAWAPTALGEEGVGSGHERRKNGVLPRMTRMRHGMDESCREKGGPRPGVLPEGVRAQGYGKGTARELGGCYY